MPAAQTGAVNSRMAEARKGSSSFLKKRTKKLSSITCSITTSFATLCLRQTDKSFWFFLKKNFFLSSTCPPRNEASRAFRNRHDRNVCICTGN